MNDKVILEKIYKKLAEASQNKDKKILEEILSDNYILIHMTGMHQTKQEYINSVLNGDLKYFNTIHESIKVNIIDKENAIIIGKSKVLASPFGMNKNWWNLQQEIKVKKENSNWKIVKSVASLY